MYERFVMLSDDDWALRELHGPRVRCPICDVLWAVDDDGRLREHEDLGARYPQTCDGSGLTKREQIIAAPPVA